MTVAELIEQLEGLPQTAIIEVYVDDVRTPDVEVSVRDNGIVVLIWGW